MTGDSEVEQVDRGLDAGGFIAPKAMEEDPAELFAGDSGTLDRQARALLVDLLRRRFIRADRNPARWKALLDYQSVLESRLNDIFVRLVVDQDRGLAYKEQVRSDEDEWPILLREEPYSRIETVLLVFLRTMHMREHSAGESVVYVDHEELEQQAMSFFAAETTNVAARQNEVRNAIRRLGTEGFVEEDSPGRYKISSLVEVVLSMQRLEELSSWLQEASSQVETASDGIGVDDAVPDDAVPDDTAADDAASDDAVGEDSPLRDTAEPDVGHMPEEMAITGGHERENQGTS